MPVPADLFAALHADTGELQAAGWNLPPGAAFVNYTRPDNAFAPAPRPRAPRKGPLLTVARYDVSGGPLHVLNLNPQTLLAGGLAHLLSQRPRGVLVTYDVSESEVGPELIAACAEARIPVAAYGYSPELRRCDVVTCDQEAGSYQLTRWLLRRGRRRILRFWRVTSDSHWLRQRDVGHERAMREAGIEPLPPVVIHGMPNYIPDQTVWNTVVRTIAGHLPEHLCGPTPIDAVMVPTDPHANQLAAAMRLFGKVPNVDVEIVGYDNTWFDEPSRIWEATGPLATVEKRCDRICQELSALMLDRIDGRLPETPQRRVVEGEFIELTPDDGQRATG